MSAIRSLLKRTFGVVKQHVGTDLLGNKYYVIPEQKTWTGQTTRKRRTVEMVCTKEYAYERGAIPSEWDAWIRGRRKDPPTREELIRNEQSRKEMKVKGEAASERDSILQEREYEDGLVSEPIRTKVKGHASAPYYGQNETSPQPASTANAFEPGSWAPQEGSRHKK
ncbi:NADH dehydrogenase [ubiquinone] 1 alpha subcomplex assembly factor 2 [Ambystoma mexicanum]|uniref:NADH dehydrogenase [ubiquinone] 1 alpha subcomplex assembly factor 2 n=1 Tax=Ambystoma mexicanum TaxID=8296 RepID=UPI0037E85F60